MQIISLHLDQTRTTAKLEGAHCCKLESCYLYFKKCIWMEETSMLVVIIKPSSKCVQDQAPPFKKLLLWRALHGLECSKRASRSCDFLKECRFLVHFMNDDWMAWCNGSHPILTIVHWVMDNLNFSCQISQFPVHRSDRRCTNGIVLGSDTPTFTHHSSYISLIFHSLQFLNIPDPLTLIFSSPFPSKP